MIEISKVLFIFLIIGASISYGSLAIFGFYMLWYAIDELTSKNLKEAKK